MIHKYTSVSYTHLDVYKRQHHQSVFPAGAGVIHASKIFDLLIFSFPRRCGGDPDYNGCWYIEIVFSPQVRG